ncbi:unnamed protein product [Pleuronectes platessa]|uniref:Uncharacterized protein n=1 Tax=Pleuronectes platessa TaxID=8262 RepID=A0A9N7VDU7_PLEPL|nr:unnamed protein product [Pleuronectes platessa]
MTPERGIKEVKRLPLAAPGGVTLLLHTCLPSNMEITPLTRDCCKFHEKTLCCTSSRCKCVADCARSDPLGLCQVGRPEEGVSNSLRVLQVLSGVEISIWAYFPGSLELGHSDLLNLLPSPFSLLAISAGRLLMHQPPKDLIPQPLCIHTDRESLRVLEYRSEHH